MKKVLLTLVLLAGIAAGLFAQKLTYQAVIRDNNRQLVTNTAVKAIVTIDFAAGEDPTWTVDATTNLHGLLTFEFGDGSLLGRDWTDATIAVKVAKAGDESVVYVNDESRPVSAVPYALSVDGTAIQNYLTGHGYVDLAKLNDTLGAYPTTADLNTLLNAIYSKIDPLTRFIDALTCVSSKVKDVDGNEYNTVYLGSQCWMAENLRTTRYADGTSIDLVISASANRALRYYPNNESGNVSTYGYLYNWKAVMRYSSSSFAKPSGVQGICPNGWHVPSDAEWTQLTDYVSSQSKYVCGGNNIYVAKALASTTGWDSNNTTCAVGNNPSANNATGFAAVPAGYWLDDFYNFGFGAYFWSATQNIINYGTYYRDFYCDHAYVGSDVDNVCNGFSVRCLRD